MAVMRSFSGFMLSFTEADTVLAKAVCSSTTSWTLLADDSDLAAATWLSKLVFENAIAWAPRASAPLVAAVTEATTASRFFLEWALASFSAARVFSTPSLKATFEAAVNWSTVVLTASAAAMVNSFGDVDAAVAAMQLDDLSARAR